MKMRIVIAAAAAMLSTHAMAADAGTQPDLTRQQALARADALFDRFDVNRDGLVTREEAQEVGTRLALQRAASGSDPAPGIGGHTLKFLERAFAGAQSVTRSQFEQAMLAHFDAMDVNHDGVLTAAERIQGRSAAEGRAAQ